MKIIAQKLYLSFAELAETGVAEITIKAGISVGRAGWVGIKDPSDNRCLLIEYEALKMSYKQQVVAKYGDVWRVARLQSLRDLVKYEMADYQYFKERIPVAPLNPPKGGSPESRDKAWQLATCAAACRVWNKLRASEVKRLGWDYKEDFLRDLLEVAALDGWCKGNKPPQPPQPPSIPPKGGSKGEASPPQSPKGGLLTAVMHPRRWNDKCKRFAEKGLDSLLPATLNNQRATKMTAEAERIIAVVYMLTKWGGERICRELNDWKAPLNPPEGGKLSPALTLPEREGESPTPTLPEGEGESPTPTLPEREGESAAARMAEVARTWIYHNEPLKEVALLVAEMGDKFPSLGKTSVKDLVTDPQFELKYGIARNGYQVWRNDYDKIMRRFKPTEPNLHWSMDGTKYEEYYWDAVAKVERRVYFFFVMDSFDRQIVGWSDSKTEDKETVRRCMRRAVSARSATPYVLQSDHGSSMINKELTPVWERLAEVFMPATVGNARAKPAEPLLKDFHETYATASVAYSGLGVKSTRARSHANQDKLNTQSKKDLGSYIEVVERVGRYVAHWNKQHQKPAPPVLKKAVRTISTEEIIDLLWSWRLRKDGSRETYNYTNNGLLLQYKNVEYEYEVSDETGVFDVSFYTTNVGGSFYVKYDDDNMSRVALFSMKTERFVGIASEKRFHAMTHHDREGDDSKRYHLELARKKEVLAFAKAAQEAAFAAVSPALQAPLNPPMRWKTAAPEALPRREKAPLNLPKREQRDYYSEYELVESDYEAAVKNPFVGAKTAFKDDFNDAEDALKRGRYVAPREVQGLYDEESDY